ncbi:efflux RND transporter periplasmic adaptor subunit [Gramella sp. BOM4]|nr:efflux RND transporter periplasmic adaptor subunit [Christiangramia bathymodioli]
MKKLILLAGIFGLFIACGNNQEQSIDDVISSGDLSQIRAKKAELSNEQSELSKEIDQLDEAIKKLDKNRNYALVRVDTLNPTTFKHYAEVQGNVATDENIVIYPEYSGILTSVKVDEGDRVSKGQVLATIDDGGLRNQLSELQAQAQLAKTTFEKQERLWNQNIGSEIQYLEAKTNYEALQSSVSRLEAQLAKTVVRAPFSGVVDDVMSEQGEVVSPGQSMLFRLISLDNMYVEADVPENYLSQIQKGTDVKIFISSVGKEFDGEVSLVGNNINPSNRTFRIEVKIPNEKNLIKPNQIATIKLNDYTAEETIVVPENSIQKNSLGESLVYLLKPGANGNSGEAQKKVIEVGYTYEDSIEVKSGLEAGDILITEGARNLREGQEVRTTNKEVGDE